RSLLYFFFLRRRRHTRSKRDWSSDVCSYDLQQTKTDFAAAYLQHFLTTQLKQTETLAQSSLVTQKLNRVADRQQASKELSQALSNTHVKVLSGEDFQNNELSFTERDLLRQLRTRSSAHTFVRSEER